MTRIAFLGTPQLAVPPLDALTAAPDVQVAAVITNPDRARGRSRTPRPPPVKAAAERLGLRVLQPERPAEIVDELRELELDAAAVVAYGAILRPEVLATVRTGFVNLHFSLLPRWRGAAPVRHAVMAGDDTTGVTTFLLDEGMDTGPIIRQIAVDIDPGETAGQLLERLTEVGTPLLVDTVRELAAGEAELREQDDEQATLAPRLEAEDARVDWARPAREVVDMIRGLNPRPGAFTTLGGERLKLWRARVADDPGDAAPGTIVAASGDGPVVAADPGAVRLLELQPAGKQAMAGIAYLNGYRPDVGTRLGE